MTIDLFYFPRVTVLPDEQRFLASAVKLAASGEFWVGADRAWEMPGTNIFFAPFVKLFGVPAIVPIRLAQAVLLVAQISLSARGSFSAKSRPPRSPAASARSIRSFCSTRVCC